MRARNVPVPEAHLVALAAGAALHRVRPWRLALPVPVRGAAGAAALTAGLLLVAASVRAAGPVHLARPTALATTGPYATRRHPMYVAWALLHLGTGLLRGSAWVVVTLPVATAWTHVEAVHEERALAARFPDEYPGYQAVVPRYVAVRGRGRLVQC